MATPTPRKVIEELDFIIREANSLKTAYRETHEIGYSKKLRERAGRSGGGHSDPSGSIVADNENVRSKVRKSAHLIAKAAEDLLGASGTLRQAVRLADLPGGYDSNKPKFVTEQELEQARYAKEKRDAQAHSA